MERYEKSECAALKLVRRIAACVGCSAATRIMARAINDRMTSISNRVTNTHYGLVIRFIASPATGSSETDKTILYVSPVPEILIETGSTSCPEGESQVRFPQVLRL